MRETCGGLKTICLKKQYISSSWQCVVYHLELDVQIYNIYIYILKLYNIDICSFLYSKGTYIRFSEENDVRVSYMMVLFRYYVRIPKK